MSDASHQDDGSPLFWVELNERLRTMELGLLHAQALLRGIDADIPPTVSVELSADDAADVLAICESIADTADQLRTLPATTGVHGEVEVCWRELQHEAGAALAAGVVDVQRVQVLARCLTIRSGFLALAELLRCTDCHESWTSATVGHVLGCFRGADGDLVRRLTEQALLFPEARWHLCDREQISRLAAVLEEHAATSRCS